MATKYWLGSAAQVPQVWTLTVSGAWADGDHVVLRTAGDSRTDVRIDFNASGLTTANIADKIYRTINAASNDDNLLDDEVRAAGCQEIPEAVPDIAQDQGPPQGAGGAPRCEEAPRLQRSLCHRRPWTARSRC